MDVISANDQPYRASQLSMIFRKLLLGVVVLAACYVAYDLGRLWNEWREISQSGTTRVSTTANLDAAAMIVPLSGHWSFADLEWNVQSQIVAGSEVESIFAERTSQELSDTATATTDGARELYEFVRGLGIAPVERAGNQVYQLDRGTLKAEMIARNAPNGETAISLVVAYPQGPSDWQVLELSPRRVADVSVSDTAHMLPLPEGAHRSGGRFDDDGQMLLELVSLNSRGEDLIAYWRQLGWEVRPSGLGDGGFSFLCAHDNEMVYAWSASSGATLENLMLVRTPASADTKR